jgi:DNA-directed RNA polymerase specialized sigma24 family protein
VPNTSHADHQHRPESRNRSSADGRAPGLPQQVSDALRRHRSGDREAMTDLVRIVSPWLQAFAHGFGLSHASVEDVAQSTLLALVRHAGSIRNPEAGLAWLVVTARREAIRVLRGERAVELVPDVGHGEPYPSALEPEAIAMERLRRTILWRHVSALPPRGQAILHEIAHGDRPDYAAFSDRTGMPVGSIGPTRQRSLNQMRRLLESDQDWLACA